MTQELDRRAKSRRRSLKGCRLVLNNKQSTIDCIVRNISNGGAGARLASPMALPDEMELLLEGNLLKVRRVWQKGLDVGLEFCELALDLS